MSKTDIHYVNDDSNTHTMRFINQVIVVLLLTISSAKSDELDDFSLGIEYYDSKEYDTAASLFLNLAEKGMIEAQHYIAGMYLDGIGLKMDHHQALHWFTQAAEQLHIPSQNALGIIFRQGTEFIEPDVTKSTDWFLAAAEQNHLPSQYNLATAYLTGTGVAKNLTLAAQWYRKSAEQGYVRAQHAIAVLYQKGQGIEQDYAKARYWYWIASNQNYAPSQYNLGLFYAAQTGDLEVDLIQAYMWLAISARNGFTQANKYGQELINLMTRQELEEAKSLARNWKPEGDLNQ